LILEKQRNAKEHTSHALAARLAEDLAADGGT
jgi:hypothetical protein